LGSLLSDGCGATGSPQAAGHITRLR
jgi:hypothetical protein